MQRPELEVVIVSHGAEALLRRCLASLREKPPASVPTRVTVVDSGSPDSTPEMVAGEFPEVRLLRRGNIGFSAANNLVLRESEAAAVLLLNPDTEVGAGALDAGLARLRSEPRIGMVGIKLVTESGELDHACKRSFPTPLGALAHFTGLGRRADAPGALSQYRATGLGDDEAGEVDAVNGAFMLCRREAVREVGLLDEGYWLYMEDLDWCHRFWDAGWKVFYEPAGVALHVKGGSSGGRRRPRQEIAFHRGMARFYRRFDAPEHNPLLNAAVYAGIAAKLAISLAITAVSPAGAPAPPRWRPPAWIWPVPTTWLLGPLVALLGWQVAMTPPGPGIDASWNAGLAMALKQGLQFGTEVVFSYGPLGFLAAGGVWYGDLAVIAFLYSAALYLVFCTALVWALRRRLPALPSALIAFLAVAVLPFFEQTVLVAVLACMAMLERERSPRATDLFLLGGAAFAALEALVKLSTGPLIGALFLIALVGLRAPWWKLLGFIALTLAGTLALWLAAGQGLGAIPDFLGNTWQIVSGYSAAMLREAEVAAWKVTAATIVAATVTVALVLAAWQAGYRDRRARWAGTVLMALVAFAVFKEGVVRTDAGHLSLYFSTACLLWVAIPWTRPRLAWMLAGAALIALAGVPVQPPGMGTHLNAADNVKLALEGARNLASPGRRQDLSEAGRAGMEAVYGLDPATLAALRGHTVAVEPWETAAVWAYRLEWAPLPVFQSYSAYTPELDRLNSAALESAAGPERILRENEPLVYPEFPTSGLDNRFPGWDPPEQQRTILCRFEPLLTTERWQTLARTPNRCGPLRAAGSAEAGPGGAVAVPGPGPSEVVFARVEGASPGGLESLWALLVHARQRQAVLDGGRRYRLIPGTAPDGLMLRAGRRIAEPAPFSPVPEARTIAIEGAGEDLRYSFFRMRVRPAATAPQATP